MREDIGLEEVQITVGVKVQPLKDQKCLLPTFTIKKKNAGRYNVPTLNIAYLNMMYSNKIK